MTTTRTPSWATKLVDASSKDDASHSITSTRQSANLFRIECARTWQQRIHQAQRKAWTETVRSMLRPSVNKQGEVPEPATPLLQRYITAPTSLLDLLPMTIIAPPPSCRLDRQGLTEAVWDYYRKGRCCSLWLPKLLPTLHATLHLLVKQCVQLPTATDQDFQLQAARYLRRHQKKRNTSVGQLLLWWAARTNAFDSMVVILEDPGGFAQSKVWNEFVSVVQEWRFEHGLPISLVVVGNVSSQRDLRLRIRHVHPPRRLWMQTFWHDLLLSQSQTPFPLPCMNRLEHLVRDYMLVHKSFALLCEQLVTNVNNFYAHPSRLVWDALEMHPPFLAWFATHGTAKTWLSMQPGTAKYTALAKCQRYQTTLQWWWTWQAKLLPILTTTNENGWVAIDVLQQLAELHSSLTTCGTELECHLTPILPGVLERYLDRPRKIARTARSGIAGIEFSNEQTQAKTLLYELIVLIGHRLNEGGKASNDSPSFILTPKEEKDGILGMVYELFELCVQSMDSLLESWNKANPLNQTSQKSSKGNGDTPTPSQPYEHHRQILVDGLIPPARELYGLLQDRWSISREEWFYNFGGTAKEFVRGVWTLVLVGLVQSKSKRQREGTMVYYEKVSVVWC